MNIYFDIETIGTTDEAVIADIAASIKAPATHKKPETIEAWMKENKDAAIAEAVAKTSFDGTLGQIVCIGWAFDDGDVARICSDDESEVLYSFMNDYIKNINANPSRPVFIGHNVIDFDLRYLWQRCVINGVKPAAGIPFDAKPWGDSVFDTMTRWNPAKRISLDRLCKALRVPTPKGDFDGSMVWDAFRAGEFEKIAEYCEKDVEAVRQCHKRMTFA